MAGFRGLFCHRRKAGHSYQQDPHVVYLYFLSYHGIAHYHLHGARFLDEYQEVHFNATQKSFEVSVVLSGISGICSISSVNILNAMN